MANYRKTDQMKGGWLFVQERRRLPISEDSSPTKAWPKRQYGKVIPVTWWMGLMGFYLSRSLRGIWLWELMFQTYVDPFTLNTLTMWFMMEFRPIDSDNLSKCFKPLRIQIIGNIYKLNPKYMNSYLFQFFHT